MNDANPNHVALIVDGNRRWARKERMPFFEVYKLAGANLVNILCVAAGMGIANVTAFLFSTENWRRNKEEVAAVMAAFKEILYEHTQTFKEHDVRVYTIGDTLRLPQDVQKALAHAMCQTATYKRTNFVLAFNYGGRWDIVNAVKHASKSLSERDMDNLTEQTFSSLLSTAPFGDPDLLIRTGGQQRISNFLMWQLAYSELHFSNLMWPDFSPQHFKQILCDYAHRERRMGGG